MPLPVIYRIEAIVDLRQPCVLYPILGGGGGGTNIIVPKSQYLHTFNVVLFWVERSV